MSYRIRKLAGYGTAVGAVALTRFSYGEQTGFNSAVWYGVGLGALSWWMIQAKPSKWDGIATIIGVGATAVVLGGIYAFNKEYGGGQ